MPLGKLTLSVAGLIHCAGIKVSMRAKHHTRTAYLVDIWFCPRDIVDHRLYDVGNLSKDIDLLNQTLVCIGIADIDR